MLFRRQSRIVVEIKLRRTSSLKFFSDDDHVGFLGRPVPHSPKPANIIPPGFMNCMCPKRWEIRENLPAKRWRMMLPAYRRDSPSQYRCCSVNIVVGWLKILLQQLCLVQVGNGIELEAVGFRFEPYRWRPCGVTWDSSRTVVVIKLRRTSALQILRS